MLLLLDSMMMGNGCTSQGKTTLQEYGTGGRLLTLRSNMRTSMPTYYNLYNKGQSTSD